MYISKFQIVNFKSFRDLAIELNENLNIFTGKNNSGKTTVLEALALWHECFNKLVRKAGRSGSNYRKDDFILGTSHTQDKYFPFDQINSVRSPNFEDIFYNRDKHNRIELRALITNEGDEINIDFRIGDSGMNYVIELINFREYSFNKFNFFFKNLPEVFGLFYASPVASIEQKENFVTDPQLKEYIHTRRSASVLRNRLYKLYRNPDPNLFVRFMENLSYILYDNRETIKIGTSSDIQQDTQVIFDFSIGGQGADKDIGLLGSGSLQIIEILLNLFQPGESKKDMNLVLLDEPDSHIHRDIQSRLMDVITTFPQTNQLFISTHNESLIRNADLDHLLHLDGNSIGIIKSVGKNQVQKLHPHFRGIYPALADPVIKEISDQNGLGFINAIEADRIIFVEGQDDAHAIQLLLNKRRGNIRKKYLFWVMGGVGHLFDNIAAYKTVFSQIKNEVTLWDKSVLIFDKDYFTDEEADKINSSLTDGLKLKTHLWQSYTFETILLADLDKLHLLILVWLKLYNSKDGDGWAILDALNAEYQKCGDVLNARFTDEYKRELALRNQSNLGKLTDQINARSNGRREVDIYIQLKQYVEQCITNASYYKLLTKEDFQNVLVRVVEPYGVTFSVENDFLNLLSGITHYTWYSEWDFLNTI